MITSVIICSHNPRPEYLDRTLAALNAQTLEKKSWELILIDNASAEPLASRIDLRWHPSARCVREQELGLTAARLRGISEAESELLVFVDDDNLLDPEYLTSALEISRDYHWIGAFGAAVIVPQYELQPSAELEPYCRMLALREEPSDRFTNLRRLESDAAPFGAGLCVRASIAHRFAEKKRQGGKVFGRRGTDLFSSDDLEFSLAAVDSGLGYGIFRRLRLTHLIPAGRVQIDYLLRLSESMVYSNDLLGRLRRWEMGEKPRSAVRELAMVFHSLSKTLRARGVDRQFQWKSGCGQMKALREFRRIAEV